MLISDYRWPGKRIFSAVWDHVSLQNKNTTEGESSGIWQGTGPDLILVRYKSFWDQLRSGRVPCMPCITCMPYRFCLPCMLCAAGALRLLCTGLQVRALLPCICSGAGVSRR